MTDPNDGARRPFTVKPQPKPVIFVKKTRWQCSKGHGNWAHYVACQHCGETKNG